MKLFLPLVIAFLSFSLSGAEKIDRIEKKYDASLKVVQYLPGGLFGIYELGKDAGFSLVLDSASTGEIIVEYNVIDYYGKKCSSAKLQKTVSAPG